MRDVYDGLGIVLATFFFVAAVTFVLRETNRDSTFLAKGYWRWLACLLAYDLVSPLLYMWQTPPRITYVEAAFLQVRAVGWTHVLIGYLTLLGFVIGGVAADIRRQKPRENTVETQAGDADDV